MVSAPVEAAAAVSDSVASPWATVKVFSSHRNSFHETSTQVRACTVSAGGNKVQAEFTQTHTDTQSMFTLFEGSVVQIMQRPIIAFVWLISVVTCVSQEGGDFCKELHSKSNPVRRQTHREINSNLIKNKDENNERWKKIRVERYFPRNQSSQQATWPVSRYTLLPPGG